MECYGHLISCEVQVALDEGVGTSSEEHQHDVEVSSLRGFHQGSLSTFGLHVDVNHLGWLYAIPTFIHSWCPFVDECLHERLVANPGGEVQCGTSKVIAMV